MGLAGKADSAEAHNKIRTQEERHIHESIVTLQLCCDLFANLRYIGC